MNKVLLAFSVMLVCLSSCDKEVPQPLTKEQIQQQIDSLAKIRMHEVDEQAKVELEHRIKIEVKIKADSILQAMLQHQSAADSAKNINIPPTDKR